MNNLAFVGRKYGHLKCQPLVKAKGKAIEINSEKIISEKVS